MKIVYLSTSIIPSRTANSIQVMKLCQAFARNGHEVVLMAPDIKEGMEPEVEDAYVYYGVDKCFEIVKLPWLNYKGRELTYGELTYSFLATRKAKEVNPALVYCRHASGCYFAAILGLHVILESHSPLDVSGKISKWMFRRLTKSPCLQKLVVITNALREYYEINYPLTRGKIQVAPDGADPILENIQPAVLPNKGKRLQVGYVGHLYKGKGIELISTLALLCPWVNFHVVGGTDSDIQHWKKECENRENIVFHGFIKHQEVFRYILAFDVVLLPNQKFVASHGKGNNNIAPWTSPLKLFEYMSAGKPIISSDLPVLREVLKHKHNALLCPPDNVDAWKDAMELLRDDQGLRERLGNVAHKDFLENYTWQVRAEKLLRY
jgi:glycosyltransferase involved in cell wall biosynthesis